MDAAVRSTAQDSGTGMAGKYRSSARHEPRWWSGRRGRGRGRVDRAATSHGPHALQQNNCRCHTVATMNTQPGSTTSDLAALEQFKRDLPGCQTWKLLETLHALEPLAGANPTIRLLYATPSAGISPTAQPRCAAAYDAAPEGSGRGRRGRAPCQRDRHRCHQLSRLSAHADPAPGADRQLASRGSSPSTQGVHRPRAAPVPADHGAPAPLGRGVHRRFRTARKTAQDRADI